MKLQDITDIKLGSTSASKVMLGTTLVWPTTSVPPPDSVGYNDGASPNGGWGSTLTNGQNYSMTGNHWFLCQRTVDGGLHNVTSQYNWVVTGDMTLTQTESATDNPYTTVTAYKYSIGSGSATLSLTDPVTGVVLFSCTFNNE